MKRVSSNSRFIRSTPEKIYAALTDPNALIKWQVPGNMNAKVHQFDLRVGGGYEMSLYYPEGETQMKGKSGKNEDRFKAMFQVLEPPCHIVETICFDTDDPAFSGEMSMEIRLDEINDGTEVTFSFDNLPPGIKPEDNEKGTLSSLEKLDHYVMSLH